MPKSSTTDLSDYLDKKKPTKNKKYLGSHSVGGDKNLDGELVIKHDGSKKRRSVIASTSSVGSSVGSTSGEIITLDDGRRVRRIKKKKKKSSKDSKSDGKKSKKEDKKGKKSRKSLGSFLATTETKKLGGSSSVAGDKIAIGKESSLTGKDYVREDGQRKRLKKKKPESAGSATDDNIISVEYIKKADGTTVKRIKKKKVVKKLVKKSKDEADETASVKSDKSKDDKAKKKVVKAEDATKNGQKKVVPAKSKVDPGDRVEIVTLPNGKRVRRIYKKAKKKPAEKDESDGIVPHPPTLKTQVSAPQEKVSRSNASHQSKTLEDFMLEKSSQSTKKGGSSSVGGDIVQHNENPAAPRPKLEKTEGQIRASQIKYEEGHVRDSKTKIDKVFPLPPPRAGVPARAGIGERVVSSERVSQALTRMSTMGAAYDGRKMEELLKKLEEAERRQKEAEQREIKLQAELKEAKETLSNISGDSDLAQKLMELEKQKKKLEKQLADNGIDPAENIEYEECVRQIGIISQRLEEIGGAFVEHEDKDKEYELRKEYHILSNEMDRYNTALVNTDEFQAEQKRKENEWNETNAPLNLEALQKLRRHMPIEIRNMSEAELKEFATPCGKTLPPAIYRRFKRTNVLQLIRRDPEDIKKMHPGGLENFRVNGLTLTERRALYEHLRGVSKAWESGKSEEMTGRKWAWFSVMKDNFKEELDKYNYHMEEFGPPENHTCTMLGRQCPMRADQTINYNGDYGFTSEAAYEKTDVKKSSVDDVGSAQAEALEIMREKRANERSEALKAHYGNKILQVAKAKGSCENMDSIMDKMEFALGQWTQKVLEIGDDDSKLTDDVKKKEIAKYRNNLKGCKMTIQNMCGRAGMSLSGVDKGDDKPDTRDAIECSLAEEVFEAFAVYTKWISDRLEKIEMANAEIKNNTSMLTDLLGKLHERNVSTLETLGVKREKRSRPLKTAGDMEKEVREKLGDEPVGASSSQTTSAAPPPGPPGRGGLLDAINNKGKPGGGRGGLLDAINAKGKQPAGPRDGLLAALRGGK